MKSFELQQIGKELSKEFLENGTPLTEGLQKVASESGLNNNQIQRVAESANVETYLTMLNKNNGGYIEFDVANPQQVKTASVEKENPWEGFSGEYRVAPVSEDWMNQLFAIEDEEKTASLNDPAQERKDIYRLRDTVQLAENRLQEGLLDIEETTEKIAHLVTQYQRSGDATESQLATVISSAAPYITDVLEDVMELRLDAVSQVKTASVSKESQLWKLSNGLMQKIAAATKLLNTLDQLKEESKTYTSKTNLLKTAAQDFIPVTETGSKVLNFMKQHPAITASVAVGIPLYWAGKSVGNAESESLINPRTLANYGNKPNEIRYPYA